MDEKAVVRQSKLIKSPHGFSTRIGGVSSGIFDSLNLGMNSGDDVEAVKENWRRFLKACNISNEEFVCGKQVHGNYVHIADETVLRPAYGEGWMADADGYVTNKKRVPLAVFTADCVPVLLLVWSAVWWLLVLTLLILSYLHKVSYWQITRNMKWLFEKWLMK